MKVIIAYDGSIYSDAAVDDLDRTGLPSDCQVLVVSVADFSTRRPTVSEFDLVSAASGRIDTVLEKARYYQTQTLNETRNMTSRVVHRLRRRFTGWKVNGEILTGKPTDALLHKVDEWNADLLIAGSHGRSAIGRFFLGSSSKSVAERATSSVRVVRRGFEKADGDPIEIILGAKNQTEAKRIVEAVSGRVWSKETRVRLVAIDDGVAGSRMSVYESIAERLTSACVTVSVHMSAETLERF